MHFLWNSSLILNTFVHVCLQTIVGIANGCKQLQAILRCLCIKEGAVNDVDVPSSAFWFVNSLIDVPLVDLTSNP